MLHPEKDCPGCPLADVCNQGPILVRGIDVKGRPRGVMTLLLDRAPDEDPARSAGPLDQAALELSASLACQARIQDLQHRVSEPNASEQRFRHLLDAAPIAVLLMRGDRYIYGNPASAEMLGYPDPGAIVGVEVATTIAPEHLDLMRRRARRARAGETNPPVELRVCTPDGDHRWSLSTSVPILLDGEPTTLIVGQDITARKQAEFERDRQLRCVEQVSEGIVITAPDGTIEFVNPAFESITGHTSAEILGENPRVLKSGIQDEAFYDDMWDTLTSGSTWRGRMVNRRRDGTHFTEECTISPVFGADGEVVNYVAVKRDITDQLRLEYETRELEIQVRQSQKLESIGRLAGGITHDLNNLLAPVIGYAEMLQSELSPHDRRYESASAIVEAGLKSRELVRQLLTFSRRQVLEFDVVDVNELLVSFRKLLRRTIREDIAIDLALGDDLPSVRGDIGQLEQVVMNLAVNAQDAMPDGGTLTLETAIADLDHTYVEVHQGASPGAHVVLMVSDTGTGMPADVRERVFEPFFTTKSDDRGTGLGLSTVYGIVKQHGGNIWVYSEPEHGTTFKVYLPVSGESPRPRTSDTRPLEAPSAPQDVTVLVVEDSDDVRALTGAMLAHEGYDVHVACNGAEAMAWIEARDRPPDLLVTDVVMPGMNGRELYETLAGRSPDLDVLYMSGYTDDVIVKRGVLEQQMHFLQKPFSRFDLLSKVHTALAARRRVP